MTTTTTTETRTRPVAHFKPWEAMTPREQAEHLVHAHGFDSEMFFRADVPSLSRLLIDVDVVDAFTTGEHPDDDAHGYSYPSAEGRDLWHAEDHEEYERGGGPIDHDHTKGA
jgi:hypothetical protein